MVPEVSIVLRLSFHGFPADPGDKCADLRGSSGFPDHVMPSVNILFDLEKKLMVPEVSIVVRLSFMDFPLIPEINAQIYTDHLDSLIM